MQAQNAAMSVAQSGTIESGCSHTHTTPHDVCELASVLYPLTRRRFIQVARPCGVQVFAPP
jgi:hypothetical protein